MSSKALLVNVGEICIGIEIAHISSIEHCPETFPLPETPIYIEGVANIRNKVYTVVDFNLFLCHDACSCHDDTRIVLLNSESSHIAIKVDRAREIAAYEESNVKNIELSLLNEMFARAAVRDIFSVFKGIIEKGENKILLLDANALINHLR